MPGPVELAAIDRGAGVPVVLVHGAIYHSGPAWAATLGPLLHAGYRVVAVDRRGHGRSPAGDARPIPLRLQAEDVRLTAELRDAVPAHVVGVSYGALVGLEMALLRPERVRSLVLVEPPLVGRPAGDAAYRDAFERWQDVRRRAVEGAPLEEWIPEWMGMLDERMAGRIHPRSRGWRLFRRHGPRMLEEEAAWEYRPIEGRVRTLMVPALVVNGGESSTLMQAAGRLLAERLPMATRRVIPGAGHDVHVRRAEAFNELLIAFLAGKGRAD